MSLIFLVGFYTARLIQRGRLKKYRHLIQLQYVKFVQTNLRNEDSDTSFPEIWKSNTLIGVVGGYKVAIIGKTYGPREIQ